VNRPTPMQAMQITKPIAPARRQLRLDPTIVD
jgi:hypothetical protein